MLKPKRRHLTYSERVIIETLVKEKCTASYIAKRLSRSVSTISRELNRWRGSRFYYSASLAQDYASAIQNSKGKGTKLETCGKLKEQVYRGLLSGLSPEAISGRLSLVFPDQTDLHISYESIYRFIYSHPQGRVNKKLIALLHRGLSRRKKRRGRGYYQKRIELGQSIENRSPAVEDRLEFGHWEGDLVIGVKQGSCIGTIVERKTRYLIAVSLTSKKSQEVCQSFVHELSILPRACLKSMTYDNGTEMANHQYVTAQTGMPVYFAHPYSSWERGTNENTNGLIRRTYPKKVTDFNKVSRSDLKKLEHKMNNTPRKVLGFHTPLEALLSELKKNGISIHDADNDGVLEMGNKSRRDLFSFLMP